MQPRPATAPRARPRASRRPAIDIPRDADDCTLTVDDKTVRLTNLRKPFWHALGLTKGDLLRYYAAVAPALLPHVAGRAMVRMLASRARTQCSWRANMPRDTREPLTRKLEALIARPGFTGRAPRGPSRWSNERSGEWEPLKPKLVVEVRYDHVSAGRFRHGTSFLRWRPDKAPRQCTFEQVRQTARGSHALLETPQAMRAERRSPGAEPPGPRHGRRLRRRVAQNFR